MNCLFLFDRDDNDIIYADSNDIMMRERGEKERERDGECFPPQLIFIHIHQLFRILYNCFK